MKKPMKIWQFIAQQFKQRQAVVLLCVTESMGSSPGRRGFKMAVSAHAMEGSIGGGIMEHKLVEMARDMLKKNEHKPVIKRQVHSKAEKKDQSGMICSGEQTIAICPLYPADKSIIDDLIYCLESGAKGVLQLSPQGISFAHKQSLPSTYQYCLHSPEDWSFEEQLGQQNQLYIIGGGHVGLALSQVMANLDFQLHLFDDRHNLNTMEQNPYVQQKTVLPYEQLGDLIPAEMHSYVVVMTFGYRSDDVVIRQLINKPLKYVGLLGSKAKIAQLLADLRKDGFSEAQLSRIHTPIGLPIASKTPEEIAISIAAEIIGVKNAGF